MTIQRVHQYAERLSEIVIYNGIVYLSGQVPDNIQVGAYEQAKQVLALIDKLLAEVNSNKSQILNTQIFLANMQDYEEINHAWDEWVDKQNLPSRTTVEAKLANPAWKVEIVVTAAINT